MTDVTAILKALTDEMRIKTLAQTCDRPQTADEIAAALGLAPQTVKGHLGHLLTAGLVEADRAAYRYSRRAVVEALRQSAPTAGVEVAEGTAAFDVKVLGDFMAGGRLRQIPVQAKKRDVILRFPAQQFDAERPYTEQEVNFLLLNYHPDYATLRRAMVDTHLMERKDGIYRRVRAGRLIQK